MSADWPALLYAVMFAATERPPGIGASRPRGQTVDSGPRRAESVPSRSSQSISPRPKIGEPQPWIWKDRFCVAPCAGGRTPLALHCDRYDGLLRSVYPTVAFAPRANGNLFGFREWLPSAASIDTPIRPVVYWSERLAECLGLTRLTIAFNGYAPEVGARNPTGSFKGFEALPTLLYHRERGINALVLASAGNTARAFAHAATVLDHAVVLVVPKTAAPRL